MKTTFRDENNKLQKSMIEEHPIHHYLNEYVMMNNKKFVITNIEINFEKMTRLIKMKSLPMDCESLLDYKNKRGDYDIIKKPK
jgi:hypothetical protein